MNHTYSRLKIQLGLLFSPVGLSGQIYIPDFMLTIFNRDDAIADSRNLPRSIRVAPNYLPPITESEKPAIHKSNQELAPFPKSAELVDLVNGIIYMFSMEISSHATIKDAEFNALSRFVKVLVDFVPFPLQTKDPLQKIYTLTKTRSQVKSAEILDIFR